MMKRIILFTTALILLPTITFAAYFPANTQYQLCFTPGEQCTRLLVHEIDHAKKSIYVQAYSFTSYWIAKSLADAYRRGVNVEVILDKSNFAPKAITRRQVLQRYHVPLWEDYKLRIAHNKVMIFDGQTVETGSFNFTDAAQYHNAENMLIIHNQALAQKYLANWEKRKQQSKRISD
jgi:phosphatidylserine/phosphatidylglycerophosphate/cardiolipin synthase-like enzyme